MVQLNLKEENLALSSGVGLAGQAVSLFWEGYAYIAFGMYPDEIINSIVKPNKLTAVHIYLYSLQDISQEVDNLRKNLDDLEEVYNFISRTLNEVNLYPDLPVPNFEECEGDEHGHWDDNCSCSKALKKWIDYVEKNSTKINNLIVHSAFQFLFQDRQFLHDFHLELADWVEDNMQYIEENYSDYLVAKKRFRRQHFPVWLKQAVLYRDKGTCVLCRADLSKLMRTINNVHIDHIVPLDVYGSNDASNMQLLCATCNTKKGARSTKTSKMNAPFWNLDIVLD